MMARNSKSGCNIIMERDALDFGRMNIPRLFAKLFVPTLMGMVFGALLNLADGIFVGRGVGSDALAAVNIAAPVFLVAMGLALMFGSGVSVVAAIHLSHDNVKAANINVTQALTVSVFLMVLVSIVILIFPEAVARLFDGSDRLMPYVLDYMLWVLPSLLGFMVTFIGMFVIRLDGSPKFAMMCEIVPSVLNILLDYICVFPLDMGIKGAAIATSISQFAGTLMVFIYFWRSPGRIHLYRPKFTRTSIRLTLRNIGYMMKLGASNFIGETAMASLMVVGNFMFISRLGEDGVAAFSVACYLFPLVFMIGNAISQSALPIISFNYGVGKWDRIFYTRNLSLSLAAVCGLLTTVGGVFFSPAVAGLFLESGQPSWQIAVDGFPWYSLSFILFAVNIVFIGYYQSIECPRQAIFFMLLRGFIFIIPAFLFLPALIGDLGLWLAVPVSELLTLAVIIVCSMKK